jgi:hypothetical protein
VLKPILRPAHLDLALESLKRFEHWSHVKLLYELQWHWIVHFFKLTIQSQNQVFLVKFVSIRSRRRCLDASSRLRLFQLKQVLLAQ